MGSRCSPTAVERRVRHIQMNRRKRVLLITLAIPAALAVGGVAFLALRPTAPVTVTIRNSSDKPIAAVRLEHERGVEVVEDLAPTESKTIRFIAGGETSYTLRVRFRDGSEVSSNPQYAESGYEFTQTVSNSGIESDVRLPKLY